MRPRQPCCLRRRLSTYRPLWVAACALNSGFSYFWDVERDWEISWFTNTHGSRPCPPAHICTAGKESAEPGRSVKLAGPAWCMGMSLTLRGSLSAEICVRLFGVQFLQVYAEILQVRLLTSLKQLVRASDRESHATLAAGAATQRALRHLHPAGEV